MGSVRQPAGLPGMCSEGQRWLVVTLGAQCSDSYQITGGSTEKQQWNACISASEAVSLGRIFIPGWAQAPFEVLLGSWAWPGTGGSRK